MDESRHFATTTIIASGVAFANPQKVFVLECDITYTGLQSHYY